MCQARIAELKVGAPQAATGVRRGGDGLHESSAFRRISQFMEKNLGGASSEYQGKKVMHTTSRERVVVWILLVLFVSGFIAAYLSMR